MSLLKNCKALLFTSLMAGIIFVPHVTWSAEYTYTELLPPGWSSSFGHDNNDLGDVVGYGKEGSVTKSFLYSNGSYTELLPTGWSSSHALRINNSKEVIGYGTDNGVDKGFIYSNGTYTELLPQGWEDIWAIRNNNNGDIVGGGHIGTDYHGFLYSNGAYTELLPEGWIDSTAYGINDQGIIAGWGTDSAGTGKGFIYDNRAYTELLPPGWSYATAYGININGEVVGEGINASGIVKGYKYSSGSYIELMDGWYDVVPEDINDLGDVAGYGNDGTSTKGFIFSNGEVTALLPPEKLNAQIIAINNLGEMVGAGYNEGWSGQRAYVFTPVVVPEPLSSALFIIGGGILGLRRFRKRKRLLKVPSLSWPLPL